MRVLDEREWQQPGAPLPYHIGMIPDGNRRYARNAGISLQAGYLAAADKALEVVGWCIQAGIRHLSAFGVSRENIERRPAEEICWLHQALLRFCRGVSELSDATLHLFGDAAALPDFVPGRHEFVRLQKRHCALDARLAVHVGINYSSHAELAAALKAVATNGIDAVAAAPDGFMLSAGVPPVDLIVRTAGQQRLSGFLPFQTAYAELWFTPTLWPEFQREEFSRALAWYAQQERRFGE